MVMKPRVLVVYKETMYSKFVSEHGTDLPEKETLQPIVSRWKDSHKKHFDSLTKIQEVIKEYALPFTIPTTQISFIEEMESICLVVTVGGDGTLLSTSHNVGSKIPVLAVNSDPENSAGFFCTTTADGFEEIFKPALERTALGTSLTRMSVKLNGKVISERVLNDVLFCHTNPATTSNYNVGLCVSGNPPGGIFSESQKSSGFWIGPPAGSTGARRSAGFAPMDLGEKSLQLGVRELYTKPGATPGRREIVAKIGHCIRAVSKMDSAAIYIDGDYKVVPVGLGDVLEFERSNDPLLLIGKPNVLCESDSVR